MSSRFSLVCLAESGHASCKHDFSISKPSIEPVTTAIKGKDRLQIQFTTHLLSLPRLRSTRPHVTGGFHIIVT